MVSNYPLSFKEQAVKSVLSRAEGVSINRVAAELGVSASTLHSWLAKFGSQASISGSSSRMEKEKKPQDWSLEERLNMVIDCGGLDEEAVSQLCRKHGLYPHHIKQWKQDFISGDKSPGKQKSSLKDLNAENKSLKKELRRKDKALAETAALIVLQKKVHAIWGEQEEDI